MAEVGGDGGLEVGGGSVTGAHPVPEGLRLVDDGPGVSPRELAGGDGAGDVVTCVESCMCFLDLYMFLLYIYIYIFLLFCLPSKRKVAPL